MKTITKKMRLEALLNASGMIEGHTHSGASPDEFGMSDEEFDEYIKQCKYVAKKLDTMATKLMGVK